MLVCTMSPLGCAKQEKFELPRTAADDVPLNERIKKAHEHALAAQNAETAGQTDKAIALYQQAIQSHREFPAAWLNLGVLQMKVKNNLEAVDAFNVASELDPDDPRPYFNVATIYDEKHYYKEAIKQYNLALEKDPNLLPALRRSIYLEMQTNSFTPATKDRVLRGLLMEKDQQYINIFSQAKIRIDNEVLGVDAPPGH
ncbi:MAG: tetratricopeptide repeat protein [Pyrinomonadaceae bacterium]|nr:tetratricopeptide repeat protein [Phycisphaerales bacterium]